MWFNAEAHKCWWDSWFVGVRWGTILPMWTCLLLTPRQKPITKVAEEVVMCRRAVGSHGHRKSGPFFRPSSGSEGLYPCTWICKGCPGKESKDTDDYSATNQKGQANSGNGSYTLWGRESSAQDTHAHKWVNQISGNFRSVFREKFLGARTGILKNSSSQVLGEVRVNFSAWILTNTL